MIDSFAYMLFLMAAAHVLVDWPLQPGDLSAAKRPGGNPDIPWAVALGGHALMHGGAVALITGDWMIGLSETIAHAMIDGAKCRGWISIRKDQTLHLLCKFMWAALAALP